MHPSVEVIISSGFFLRNEFCEWNGIWVGIFKKNVNIIEMVDGEINLYKELLLNNELVNTDIQQNNWFDFYDGTSKKNTLHFKTK